MSLKRRSILALAVALMGILLALCLVPRSTYADEGSVAEEAGTSTEAAADGGAESEASTNADGGNAEDSTGASDESSDPAADEADGTDTAGQADEDASSSDPAPLVLRTPASPAIAVKSEINSNISIYYVENGSERIILYCMNNKLAWPNSSAGSSLPYVEGYLTEDYFMNVLGKTAGDYQQCMRELEYLLYAGYPYNGMNLYTITSKGKEITEDEFNAMLVVPDYLRSDFADELGDAQFTYSDYTQDPRDSSTNMGKLQAFVNKVFALGETGKTASGLTRSQVHATDFYKAANCMLTSYYYGDTPLAAYDVLHGHEGNNVTIAEANEATQYAVWALLQYYGVPDNSIEESSYASDSLVSQLIAAARRGANLQRAKPTADQVSISGDSQFAYDPESGTWRTGWLTIAEPATYRGIYALSLPSGMIALTEDGVASSIEAGTKFRISSSAKPTTEEQLSLQTTLVWTEGIRQYTPQEGQMAPSGKQYQHMLGEVVHTVDLSKSMTLLPTQEGSLKVTKTVAGESGSGTGFSFTVTLGNTGINGTYGDMAFKEGVATISLKDGETATAEHLPAGVGYTVTEEEDASYRSSSEGSSGTIKDGETAVAAFTNTKLYGLTVGKVVSGTANGSSEQEFPLVVTLTSPDGTKVEGTFNYTGGVMDGSGAVAPADGSLAFTGGEATISLKSGQKIALSGIPSGTAYSVNESGAQDGVYDDGDAAHTSYDVTGTTSGTLAGDAEAIVTNAVRTGSLEVTKHVTQEIAPTGSYAFTVTLGGAGAGLSGTYGEMAFENGVATFELADGQTAAVSGLPEGTTYEVKEAPNASYTTTSEGAQGTIEAGKASEAVFTNARNPIVLPLTGSDGVGPFYLAGILIVGGVAAWMHISRSGFRKGGDGRD